MCFANGKSHSSCLAEIVCTAIQVRYVSGGDETHGMGCTLVEVLEQIPGLHILDKSQQGFPLVSNLQEELKPLKNKTR